MKRRRGVGGMEATKGEEKGQDQPLEEVVEM
jgi:hypothetical protein